MSFWLHIYIQYSMYQIIYQDKYLNGLNTDTLIHCEKPVFVLSLVE